MSTLTTGPLAGAGRFLAWSLAGDLAAKVAVACTTFIAVRTLSPLNFGSYVGMYAASLLAAAIWDFGVSGLLTREFAARRVSLGGAISRVAKLRLILLPAWLVVFGLSLKVLAHGVSLSPLAVVGFAAGSLCFGSHTAVIAMLRGALGFRSVGIVTALGRWLTAGLSLFALGAATPFDVLALAFFGGEALTLCLASIALARGGKIPDSRHTPKESLTLRAAAPFAANGIMATAYNRFDVLILVALSSARQLSFYAPASRIQDALYLIPSSLGAIAFPMMSRLWPGTQGPKEVRRLMRHLIGVGLTVAIPVAVAASVFTPTMIRFVLGADYDGAVTATRILVWFLPLAVIQAPILAGLAASGHAAKTTQVFAATFAAALVLHLCFDWWAGATGAAIASLSRDPVGVALALFFAYRLGLLGHGTEQRPTPTALIETEAVS